MARITDIPGLTKSLKEARSTEEKDKLWEQLFPLLHRVARNRINAAGRRGLDRPTELVSELFPGLQRALENPKTTFESRAHFLAYAAQAMRRHLAAQARQQVAQDLLDDGFAAPAAGPAAAIAISDALDALSERLPRAVRAFELREYGGYSYEEILDLMRDEYRTKALLAADLTAVRKALARMLTLE